MQSRARIETDRSVKVAVTTVATLFVAIVGVSLLTAERGQAPRAAMASLPSVPSAAASPAPSPEPSSAAMGPDAGGLEVGRHWARVGRALFSFEVPTPGWSSGSWGAQDAAGSEPADRAWHDPQFDQASIWLTWIGGPMIHISAPERVVTDPCGGAGRSVGPSVAALADVLARLPGTRADRSDTFVGGFPATRLDLRVLHGSACPSGRFRLWEVSPGMMRSTPPGTTIAMWIVRNAGTRLVIDAEMPDSPSLEAERTVSRFVDSLVFTAPFAPDGPLRAAPPAEAWQVPVEGALDPGWYSAIVASYLPLPPWVDDVYAFGYRIRTEGWAVMDGRPGTISRGSIPSPSGAILRFSSPDEVATDPCGRTLMRPTGPSTRDLGEAIAAIPGLIVRGPISDGLQSGTTAESLILTIPKDIACDPSSFQLWYGTGADTGHGPRTPAARGSTIRLWIFRQDDRPDLPRVMIESETFPGASEELEQEIDSIISSLAFFGG